jgi:hypothetical protein
MGFQIEFSTLEAWGIGIQSFIEVDDMNNTCFAVFSIDLLLFSFRFLVPKDINDYM